MGIANQSFSHVFTVEGNNVRVKTPPSLTVRVASTANIADLTAASVVVDGVTCVAGDLVLLKDQTTGAENGFYAVGDVASALAALTRVWPLESGDEAMNGTSVYVQSGTLSAGSTYVLSNAGTATVGTTALTFGQVPTAAVALQKRTVTIGHADLTDADTSQTVNIGAVLPANARILGTSIHTVTAFAGGSVSALAVDIGTSGDVDAIVDGADLFATVVDGQAASRPLGISPNKLFASAGAQLIATVVSTGDNLVNLTAGAMTIDVFFSVLA